MQQLHDGIALTKWCTNGSHHPSSITIYSEDGEYYVGRRMNNHPIIIEEIHLICSWSGQEKSLCLRASRVEYPSVLLHRLKMLLEQTVLLCMGQSKCVDGVIC